VIRPSSLLAISPACPPARRPSVTESGVREPSSRRSCRHRNAAFRLHSSKGVTRSDAERSRSGTDIPEGTNDEVILPRHSVGRTSKENDILLTMLSAALVATALLGGASLATAGDFCLGDNFTNTIVGKGFSLPSEGACKDFHGFLPGTDVSLFGDACGSSDNTRITFSPQPDGH
jgi:hypothetical protein